MTKLHALIKDKGLSVAAISRSTGIPYTTISELVSGKTEIGRTRFDVICSLADTLGVSLDDIRELGTPTIPGVSCRNKMYYYNDKPLCKINEDNNMFIDTLIDWAKEDEKLDKEFEAWEHDIT